MYHVKIEDTVFRKVTFLIKLVILFPHLKNQLKGNVSVYHTGKPALDQAVRAERN